jgi:FkbM family methyltransferase
MTSRVVTHLWLGLRKIAIGAFRRLNPGDISIRHHYTGNRIKLHSFMHKGYWFYGKRRERETMELFGRLLRPGDAVMEIGGHIGYISLYFADLVGSRGQVTVFEPGPNNLPYIRANVGGKSNVRLIEKAVADFAGTAPFYVENYTGQNNSLLADYVRFQDNLRSAGLQPEGQKSVIQVDCITLDDFLAESGVRTPSLIKIDVEGAELAVLRGMERTLRFGHIALMIEVTENASAIYELLKVAGFDGFTEDRKPVLRSTQLCDNSFWLKSSDSRYSLFTK